MELFVIGLNHNTAPLQVRERFAFSETATEQALKSLAGHDGIYEAVLLSTCNRTELYAVLDDTIAEPARFMGRILAELAPNDTVSPARNDVCFYVYQNEACVRHLLKVAASLDSQILGENQILGQVKTAYALAHAVGTTKTVLNILFHRAITAGKKVRAHTRISQNPVSISTAAIELVRKHYADLAGLRIMLIGAGKMGRLTVSNLKKRGGYDVCIVNRDFGHARELANQTHCRAVPWAELHTVAATADIIISSTAAPDFVLNYTDVAQIVAQRKDKPLLLVDIAMPRDIDPTVNEISGVKLFNIDDLETITRHNHLLRLEAAALAAQITEHAAALAMRKLTPALSGARRSNV